MKRNSSAHAMDSLVGGVRIGAWQVDTIHATPADRLVFRPDWRGDHTTGIYVMQMGERITVGTYQYAHANIGDAEFLRRWENTYAGQELASAAAWHIIHLLLDANEEQVFELLEAVAPQPTPDEEEQ